MFDSENEKVPLNFDDFIKKISIPLLIIAAIAAPLIGVLPIAIDPPEVGDSALHIPQLLAVISVFIFIAAAIEQTCEVVLDLINGAERLAFKTAVDVSAAKFKLASKNNAEKPSDESAILMVESEAELDAKIALQLAVHTQQKKRSHFICVAMATMAALAGFHFLHHTLTALGVDMKTGEQSIIPVLDVLITSLLLIGGADRIHQVVKDWFTTKKQTDALVSKKEAEGQAEAMT